MKLNCGPDAQERQDIRDSKALVRRTKRRQWHIWFAWHPVRVGKRDCRWFEIVERRKKIERQKFIIFPILVRIPGDGIDVETDWEYRAHES